MTHLAARPGAWSAMTLRMAEGGIVHRCLPPSQALA
jgi:hypothetical protein